jgi:arylsulfatase A-like enzyme
MKKPSKKAGLLLGGVFAASFGMAALIGDGALPLPDPSFKGKIAQNREESIPSWPELTKAQAGAPNIVLILLDDAGFGLTSTFGGAAQTPELDRLASHGLRYNRFHVVPMCSPTRAALLTGRNSHQVGFGNITELSSGYPGYNSIWPRSTSSIPEILRQNGYSTAAFGKWHNTPVWEDSPAGPFDHWPTGLGFEYFYGFMGGANSQWEPRLYRNTWPIEPPAKPETGYHLTTDLVDNAIRWLHQHEATASDKPFFLYFAAGATHEPHHVPKQWIAQYKGKFDQGWDKLREETFARQKKLGVIPPDAELTPRPKEMPAWDSLTADQKKLFARQMEVYAAFMSQTDYEIGRLLQAIQDEGKSENTLVLYILGDNGASMEGGLDGHEAGGPLGNHSDVSSRVQYLEDAGSELFHNHHSAAWAWGTDAPFQWGKQVASHLGGTRDPLIVSWPARIHDGGGLRSQFSHVNDIAPTIYDVAGIKFPDMVNGVRQIPLEGRSLAYSFDRPEAPSVRTLQYFELLGSRGIYKDGWWAGALNGAPWEPPPQKPAFGKIWELYDLTHDFSQAHDLADKYPQKLKELQEAFDSEARRNNVYPLLPSPGQGRPSSVNGKTSFTYYPGVTRLTRSARPHLSGVSHRIVADLQIPGRGAEGVIIANGGRYGGYTLYVKSGKVIYEASSFGPDHQRLVTSDPLPVGKVQVVFEFIPDKGVPPTFDDFPFVEPNSSGVALISINGKKTAEGHFSRLGGFDAALEETLDIGSDSGSPVTNAYESPFAFTGNIDKVKIELLEGSASAGSFSFEQPKQPQK